MSAEDTGLGRNAANFTPLTPLGFIERVALAHPQRTAIIYGDQRQSWAQTYRRARQLDSALARRGVGIGDTVAVMAPNTPAMYEAHFGVPMAGAALNALNYRLDAATIGYILGHSEARVLITDTEFAGVLKPALAQLNTPPLVVDITDALGPGGERLGDIDYEAFLGDGDADYAWSPPADEWDAITLNYTSGTTGRPKGVVYHHRGAFLNAVANVLVWEMKRQPVYLWTLPMFHCNGWCFPWSVAAQAGTNVCLRRVDAGAIYNAFADHAVTHLCGAPIVMQMIIAAGEAERRPVPQRIAMMTAAAAPPASVLADMARLGIDVTHVYGLTEVYGPAVVCDWHPEWGARKTWRRRPRLESIRKV